MHSRYGAYAQGRHLADIFSDCLYMITPDLACNIFDLCVIEIPFDVRDWANRADEYEL
jgi:hypothetical protein